MVYSMKLPTQPIFYRYIHEEHGETVASETIVETPVSLTVNGDLWLTFMCTPVELEAMMVGFLYNERIISSRAEIEDVRLCAAGDNVDVWLNHSVEKPVNWRRTSGCTGGVTSIGEGEAARETAPAPAANGGTLLPQQVTRLVANLFESQELYRSAGGVHTSALSDGTSILISAEDVGRHNTLDKIAGRCLLDGIGAQNGILLTTGRISSEMMQKAARIGANVVISRTSPTSLSIELAEELGITLIGYARRDRFNVYTHAERMAEEWRVRS